MVDFTLLQETRKHFSRKDIPFLNALISKLSDEKPYKGLRIIYNAHMTLSSLLQIEALAVSGADVTVTVGEGLRVDPKALDILYKAGIRFIPYQKLVDENYDLALDCCAMLIGKITPKYGVAELTQTGVIKYIESQVNYPVISVDNSKIKTIETLFGTGDGFVRGFRQCTNVGLHHRRFVIFGYGKVGQGIVHALHGLTHKIIVIDRDPKKVEEAIAGGVTAYLIDDKQFVQKALKNAFCIVTATGEKNLISDNFNREDISAEYLANMGSEDEWGDKFLKEEILNNKLAINFCLEEPTRVLFLDPIFYSQIISLDLLLKENLSPGVYPLPKEFDLEVLNTWTSKHYRMNVEGDYLQSIIKHIPCYVYWKDKSSIYQGCNEKFAVAAGFKTPDEVIGKTDYELAWGKTEAEVYRKGDQETFKGKVMLNFEETQKQADGNQIIVLASKVPFHDDDGNIIGVLGVYTDITDRKNLEEELVHAKDKAEQSDKLKTEFIHNIEHDIRTPLGGLWGLANMLAQQETDPEKNKIVKMMEQSAKELLEYHNNILDFAKTETGVIPILEKKFNLKELIQKIVKIERPEAEIKHVVFLAEFSENFPEVVIGDPNRIERILLNIVGNSFKFTQKGYVKIKADVAKKTSEKVIVHLIVEDTGIGISKQNQEHIYEKFTRVIPSNKGLYKGTGLGLHVVKQLLEDINGEIDVKSEEGKGATFTCTIRFKLPLVDEVLSKD